MNFKTLKITAEEFNRRCHKVFTSAPDCDIEYYAVSVKKDHVSILVDETESNGKVFSLEFIPMMKTRPQALDYILGKRNDFND